MVANTAEGPNAWTFMILTNDPDVTCAYKTCNCKGKHDVTDASERALTFPAAPARCSRQDKRITGERCRLPSRDVGREAEQSVVQTPDYSRSWPAAAADMK
jgi:hypothetical protein